MTLVSDVDWKIWVEEIATLLVEEDGEYLPLSSFRRLAWLKVLSFNENTRALVVEIPQTVPYLERYVTLKYVPMHDTNPFDFSGRRSDQTYRLRRHDMAREIEFTEGVTHRRIIEYYAPVYRSSEVREFGERAVPVGYLMEHCGEGDIGSVKKPYSLEALWDLTEQLTSLLADLHEHDILHLDIKGANILRKGADVRLIDFGMAIHRRSFLGGGTSAYLPPEEVYERDRPAQRRGYDVYAMCMTLVRDAFLVGRGSRVTAEAFERYENDEWRMDNESFRRGYVALVHRAVHEVLVGHSEFSPIVRLLLRGIAPDHTLRWGSIIDLRRAIAAL